MMPPPPHWLEAMLATPFFASCRDHPDAARSERNLFCVDCPSASAFCFYCRSDRHSSHRVVQIRRSSYHDVVRVSEVQGLLDISGVQTYVINSARVLFLNERPQPRGGGAAASTHACEICARSLIDTFRFCSLGCKLVAVKRNGGGGAGTCFVAGAAEGDGASASAGTTEQVKAGGGGSGGSPDRRRGSSRKGVDNGGNGAATPPPSSSSSRRRKGLPRRSPFAS